MRSVSLTIVLLLTSLGVVSAKESKVPAAVWQKAQAAGVVRVIVTLNIPWQVNPLSESAQRAAIATAQNELLAELIGTHYTVTARFEIVPGISLIAGQDALLVLDRSTRVAHVMEDRPGPSRTAKPERLSPPKAVASGS